MYNQNVRSRVSGNGKKARQRTPEGRPCREYKNKTGISHK